MVSGMDTVEEEDAPSPEKIFSFRPLVSRLNTEGARSWAAAAALWSSGESADPGGLGCCHLEATLP